MSEQDDINSILQRAINRWHDKPRLFLREGYQGCEPASWQDGFIQAVNDYRRTTVRAGQGPGKSCTVVWTCQWFILTRTPATILITGPKHEQVIDVIWSEFERWRQRLVEPLSEVLAVNKDLIFVKGLERINQMLARTARAENPDALRGYHDPNMLLISEESSGVPDATLMVGEGAMSSPNARTVLIGNMSRTSGYFYDSHFADFRNRWHKIHVNSEDVAQERPDIVSPEFIQSMADRYGVDSDQYRVAIKGEPPKADAGSVIPRYLIDSAVDREIEVPDDRLVVWGLDIGRNRDRSALTKRHGPKLLEKVKTWRITDTALLVDAIVEEYRQQEETNKKLLPVEILVDTIGLGGPVADQLRRARLPARDVNVNEGSSLSARFYRKRDELYFKALEWFESRAVCIPNDPDFAGELSSIQWDGSTGKIKVQSKREIIAQNGESCDLSDSFILTFASMSDRLPIDLEEVHYGKNRRRTSAGDEGSWMSL